MKYIKSPIFWMGNKYDLLYELLPRFPKKEEIDVFIDLFGGCGTISLNVDYNNIIYNELNNNVVDLLMLIKNNEPQIVINHIKSRVEEFDLNKEGTDVRRNIKDIEKIRNYYSDNYFKFRDFYNKQENKNILDLFTLTFFSFCNLIRFNSKNEFNMPFGNRCFIKEHETVINNAYNVLQNKNITFSNNNAFNILKNITNNNKRTFVYCDPPYTNTTAIYNEQIAFGGWSIEDDYKLFAELDRIDKLGVKFALSNVLENKGLNNDHIYKWAIENNYNVIYLEDKNYSALGKGNANSKEVLITNYEPPYKKYNIFDFI